MFARRRALLVALQVLDLTLMVCAFGVATVAAYRSVGRTVSLSEFVHMRVAAYNLLVFGGLVAAWHSGFRSVRLYESRRLSSRRKELLDVLRAVGTGTVAVLLTGTFVRIELFTPAFLAVFWLAASSLMVASRVVLRALLGWVPLRGRNQRNLLIVGTNPRTFAFARHVDGRPELGYRILGFVDERRRLPDDGSLHRYDVVCGFRSFAAFLREHVVDEVVLALPVRSLYAEAARIVSICEDQGILVRCLSNLFDIRRGRTSVDAFHGHPVVTVSCGPIRGLSTTTKRLFDILASATILVALAPVLVAVMFAIKLSSRGPVYFAQERLGLSKRTFRLYKFRTMVVDAEARQPELEKLNEADGPVFKIRNDPRITPIGRLLRKTSLDELPQLVNVLKGDMSLVGPRPLPVRDYKGFDADWHRRRFSVRPGITCLWQVMGRSNTSFERWMALDLEYIDGWSLGLDFKILARTIPAVISGSGAA